MAENWIRRETVIAHCKGAFPDVWEDYPFHDSNWTVLRHRGNKKALPWCTSGRDAFGSTSSAARNGVTFGGTLTLVSYQDIT